LLIEREKLKKKKTETAKEWQTNNQSIKGKFSSTASVTFLVWILIQTNYLLIM